MQRDDKQGCSRPGAWALLSLQGIPVPLLDKLSIHAFLFVEKGHSSQLFQSYYLFLNYKNSLQLLNTSNLIPVVGITNLNAISYVTA
jgi:hypothetical protein